jgi:hypothetical protein
VASRRRPQGLKTARTPADRSDVNVTVSPQIRIVALAGLVALVGLATLVFMLSRHGVSSSSSPSVTPGGGATARPHVTQTPVPAHPAAKPAVKHPAAKPHVSPAVTAALHQGWPKPVAEVLASNRVVVIEFYSSDAPLDRQALAEATAGAQQAGVGFYPVDVTTNGDAAMRAILRKSDTLTSPTTIVLRRPGTIAVRLDGFQDQASVAQAAVDAGLS